MLLVKISNKNGSAYRDEHGRNFTSAIPTNVFGPNDNLYGILSFRQPAAGDDFRPSVT